MSTDNPQFSTFAIEKDKNNSINFKNIINTYKHYWYVFIIAIIAALIIAFVYLEFTAPTYEIKSTLLINQDNTNSTQQQQSVLDKLDLPTSPEVVQNEIAKLKSPELLLQVVKDLHLNISYKIKKKDIYWELYTSSPFRFILVKPNSNADDESRSLTVYVKNQNLFEYKNSSGSFEQHQFNTNIVTDMGTWKLVPSANINDFKNATIKVTVLDPEDMAIAYQKVIDASLEDKLASAIDLTISDNNKERGKDILNTIMNVYDSTEVAQKEKETQSTINFIDQRLASLTGELTSAEKNIATFKSSNDLTDIDSDAKYQLGNLQNNDTKLNDINVQLSIVNGIENYINSPGGKGQAPAVIGIADATLVTSVEKLSQLELEREQLLATTPETNPDFEPINRQIQSTKAAIKQNVENIKSSLLNARAKLQSVNSNVQSAITNIPGKEREYISIKRQQSIKENLYVYLLQKREEVSLNYATTVKNYRVLSTAYSGPVKWPKKNIVYLAAFIIGIVAAAAFIFLKDKIHNAIINPEDVENELNQPNLGEINLDKTKNALVVGQNNLINEQFKTLRSKLHYLKDPVERSRVILITSSIANEGKSFISSNLGVTLASTGKKTIILELDMRRSKLAGIFKLPENHSGIADYLNNNIALKEIIQPSGIVPSLDIISGGKNTFNAAELLESDKLNQLIAELKNTYDNIVIDSPPVHLVSDALIVSRLANITLYVIKQGFTKKSELKFIKSLITDHKLPSTQIIFNGLDTQRYGYGYVYDNSYYKVS